MKKEYDLINELGYKNWLDIVAGEAVILGHCLNDSCLVADGTSLATLIESIHFDNDDFGKVEAAAQSLEKKLMRRKELEKGTIFIDQLNLGREMKKTLYDWEFDFNCVNGIYQILMFLPEYFDREKLLNKVKIEAEKEILKVISGSGFDDFRKEKEVNTFGSQTFETVKYFDKRGKVIRKTVDFNHEGSIKRGWTEYYYFEDFATAGEAWMGVREAFISNQKK